MIEFGANNPYILGTELQWITMVESLIQSSVKTIMWKKKLYANYKTIGLARFTLPLAIDELLNSRLRKTNYQTYKGMLRQFYRDRYGLELSDRMDPVKMQEVLLHKVYSNFSDFTPDKNSVVVDVGAQYGDYALLCSKVFGVKSVYSFEPLPSNFDILEENMAINHASNVKSFNAAVGASNGSVMLSDKTDMASAFDKNGNVKTEVVALDSMNLTDVDMMKIDVEGFEMEVLKGACETIKRYHPRMIIEVHSSSLREEVLKFTRSLGYREKHHDRPRVNKGRNMDFVQNVFFAPEI